MRFVVKETDEVVVQPPISSDAIIGNSQGIFKGLPKHSYCKQCGRTCLCWLNKPCSHSL